MKTIIISLFVYLSIDGNVAEVKSSQANNLDQAANVFISLQKELPDQNLYRKKGHWIVRATSDSSGFLTRAQYTLQNDQVIVNEYIGQKRVYTGVQSHIKDNKAIQTVGSDGQQRISICFYQDDKILISLLDLNGKQVLRAWVKAQHSSYIDDNAIRNVISHNVLNKPNARALFEGLVNSLVFVNQNLPPINFDLDHPEHGFNVAESDLIDSDLSRAVGNWTIQSLSGGVFNHLTHLVMHLNGDQLVADFISNAKNDLSATMQYYGESRVIRTDMYGHKKYIHGQVVLFYRDGKQFIAMGKTSIGNVLGVYCRVEFACDETYLKGVIDNLLLFTQDVKREIKDLVPLLQWRK